MIGASIGAVRLTLVLLAIAFGALACVFAGLLGARAFAWLAMNWHRCVARLLGVRACYRGAALARGALLVSNHISWLDIPLFGGRWPLTFLGNREITRWPVLGWVFKRSGTLFIERGKGAKRAVAEIGAALRRGRSVMLFPEGRTTDGRSVLRFQPRLMQAAIDAAAPLQPAAIRYFDAAGRRVTRHSFAGDATLLASAWRTAVGARITAEITLFEPLHAAGDDAQRQALADQAEAAVRALVEK
ncbi:MAG: lysophospholipid acyltransferase family protein [bacterium]